MIVLGGTGQLGTAFRALVPEATILTRAELDLATATLADIEAALASAPAGPVINCAAYTKVDDAEAEEDLAARVNGDFVGHLATVAGALGLPFVTFSTDYVFDGTATEPYVESSRTAPINAYGRSKLVGERLALEAHPGCLVVRTSWLISGTHPNFVATVLRKAREAPLGVIDDQWGCPTIVDDLAAAALEALGAGVTGLLHLTNTGVTTWYGLARAAVRLAGFDPDRIVSTTSDTYPTVARRPAYSVLGSEVLPRFRLAPLPPWQDSLPAVVDGLLDTVL